MLRAVIENDEFISPQGMKSLSMDDLKKSLKGQRSLNTEHILYLLVNDGIILQKEDTKFVISNKSCRFYMQNVITDA
jgi:hypothetical protein